MILDMNPKQTKVLPKDKYVPDSPPTLTMALSSRARKKEDGSTDYHGVKDKVLSLEFKFHDATHLLSLIEALGTEMTEYKNSHCQAMLEFLVQGLVEILGKDMSPGVRVSIESALNKIDTYKKWRGDRP